MRLAREVAGVVDDHSYPTTTGQLIDEHGDLEMSLPNGDATLGEILALLPDETLESAEDARLSTYSALSEAAIGRKGYSDRDPTSMGEPGHEPLSL